MSIQANPGGAEMAAEGHYVAGVGQAPAAPEMARGQAAPEQAAGGEQGCSCGGEGESAEHGCEHGQEAAYGGAPQGEAPPQGMPYPGMMGGPPPQGMPHPGMMGGPPPQGMPHPGMMGGPPPQGMPHPGMMGGPPPQGMPHPGMMGGQQPGGHSGGYSCHDNPMAGEFQAGQMFGAINDIMNGNADPSTLAKFLDTSDPRFWKGLLVGAALTFVLTNSSVKSGVGGLMGGLFGAGKEEE